MDDEPALSDSALSALLDFYAEQNDSSRIEHLRTNASRASETALVSISDFKEDWHASQFWFTDKTAEFLAREVLAHVTSDMSIAVVSAPTVFIQMKHLLSKGQYPSPARLCLFEYDSRFKLLDGYVKYDFNQPTQLPVEMEGVFDQILWDPPYHSRACIADYALTVKWLAKELPAKDRRGVTSRRILCTGEIMEDYIKEILPTLKMTAFRPQHTVRLDNRYACFADFELHAQEC